MSAKVASGYGTLLTLLTFFIPITGALIVWGIMLLNQDGRHGMESIILNPIVAPVLTAGLLSIPCLVVILIRGFLFPSHVSLIDCIAFIYQSILWVIIIYFGSGL